ncbi:MAG: hypothetical protein NO516_00945 [Candidatus Methanomethylicia archaeon]|nr:hypothetical protein [Candidatus Methanomethylicia archaeon]
MDFGSCHGVMRIRFSKGDRINGFAILINGGTEAAKRLKEKRIPFTVSGPDSFLLGGKAGPGKEVIGLAKASLGDVFIVVTDRKRLRGVPWVSRYGGSTASEKALQLIEDLVDLLPTANMIVLLSDGDAWRFGGCRFFMPEAKLRELTKTYPILGSGE